MDAAELERLTQRTDEATRRGDREFKDAAEAHRAGEWMDAARLHSTLTAHLRREQCSNPCCNCAAAIRQLGLSPGRES